MVVRIEKDKINAESKCQGSGGAAVLELMTFKFPCKLEGLHGLYKYRLLVLSLCIE